MPKALLGGMVGVMYKRSFPVLRGSSSVALAVLKQLH